MRPYRPRQFGWLVICEVEHQNSRAEEGVRWPIRALTAEADKHGKAAVKIVDDRGIESLKILPLGKA